MCVFVSIAMGWTFVLFSTSHWDGLLPGSPINVSDTMNGVTDKTRQNKWFQTNTADAIKHSYFFFGGGNSKTPIQSFPGRFCTGSLWRDRTPCHLAAWKPNGANETNLRTGNHGCLVGGLEQLTSSYFSEGWRKLPTSCFFPLKLLEGFQYLFFLKPIHW